MLTSGTCILQTVHCICKGFRGLTRYRWRYILQGSETETGSIREVAILRKPLIQCERSPMSLRDTQVVILETSRDTIRIRIGLHEFLRAPSFVRKTTVRKELG